MNNDRETIGESMDASLRSSTSSRRGVLKVASGLMAAAAVGGVAIRPNAVQAATASGGSILVEIPSLGIAFPALSFQYGIGRGISSPTGGGREASAPSLSEVVITKNWDAATPLLQLEAAAGDPLPEVIITFLDAKKVAFGAITLGEVMVSGASLSNGGDLGSAGESLSLNYVTIEVDFQGEHFGWDLAAAQPI